MNSTLDPSFQVALDALTPEQKWEAFQFLWKEVAEGHADEIEPPHWHEEILKERAKKIADGKAEWLDFDQAMDELEAEFK